MPELNFRTASIDEISDAYFREGSVLLRNFVNVERLRSLSEFVDQLYEEIDEDHIFPHHLKSRNLANFHEFVFQAKHHSLLEKIFGSFPYDVSVNTATRRVRGAPSGGGHWQAPLGPHLDSFFHEPLFTVNFWVPFRDCGLRAPSVGVVRCPFTDILRYSGYGSGVDPGPHLAEFPHWNFDSFDNRMYALALEDEIALDHFRQHFADRIWTPAYAFGDAMMSSNWTLHFTHATPEMDQRRGSIELRFVCVQTVEAVLAAHS